MEVTYREISLESISPNNRTVYELESIEVLSSSILREGQLEPIQVSFAGDSFRILDGERRWRACKRLGMARMKAVIVETASDGEVLW